MHGKHAVTGIETLILFIVMVLIAAIASGVYVSTSNALQQKALHVGTVAQDRVSNGYGIIRVFGYVNQTTNTIDSFDALIRLQPGSSARDINDLTMVVYTPKAFFEATLQSTKHSEYASQDFSDTAIGYSTQSALDLDLDHVPDGNPDTIQAVGDVNLLDAFRFHIGDEVIDVPLNIAIGDTGYLNLTDYPIYEDGSHSLLHGYLTVRANFSTDVPDASWQTELTAGTFRCADHPAFEECSLRTEIDETRYATLKPLTRFSATVKQGDADMILEDGETFLLRHKLIPAYYLEDDQFLNIDFVDASSVTTTISMPTPQVIYGYRVQIWP
ncbi:MAG: archaellin/type IV pilin N-terminal domain-containing protein [Nanoarchaeota archaeon]